MLDNNKNTAFFKPKINFIKASSIPACNGAHVNYQMIAIAILTQDLLNLREL